MTTTGGMRPPRADSSLVSHAIKECRLLHVAALLVMILDERESCNDSWKRVVCDRLAAFICLTTPCKWP
jgi:hypothetical protein